MPAETPRRLALVSLPWSRRGLPSAAMGALAAWVEQERPEIEVVCRSEFMEVSERVGSALYDQICDKAMRLGELMYLAILYPERAASIRAHFVAKAPERLAPPPEESGIDYGVLFDELLGTLTTHLDELAEELSSGYLAVGLTTCFGQLFPNVALAVAMRRRGSTVPVILGGSSVSSRVGPSLMNEYDAVDYVIQGEGERPLVALLDVLRSGELERADELPAVLTRRSAPRLTNGAQLQEVSDMNALPIPAYDEYVEKAEALGLQWILPVEGARGCWWDRRNRTGNAKASCYFCNIGIQWRGYREKTPDRVAHELDVLTQRYQNLNVLLLEPIQRLRGLDEMTDAIDALDRDFSLFYEMRASIRPYELLRLWEAGLRETQFGVEALSTSMLDRIGKGTKTIQNLQVLRLCAELGVEHFSNLVTDFPGSTQDEVEETLQTIRLANAYGPLRVSHFSLEMGSTVELLPEEFEVTDVRNPDEYRVGLPDGPYERLAIMERSSDRPSEGRADWSPVGEACARWSELHEHGFRPLLRYRDGGNFLSIEDERNGDFRSGTLPREEREVYLYCTEIRTRKAIGRRFPDLSAERLDEILGQLVEHELTFCEGDRYLSLAVAAERQSAIARIRRHHAEALAEKALVAAKKPQRVHLKLAPA